MKFYFIAFFLVLVSVSTQAATKRSVRLTEDEKAYGVRLFNRLGVSSKAINADCSVSSAVIKSTVRGFNHARWTATFNQNETVDLLADEEVPPMVRLFSRARVPVVRKSILHTSTATLFSRVCNMRPASWTLEFTR